MTDAERYKLLYGPYHPPRCKLGKYLFCEVGGSVQVKGMSGGRIPWPVTQRRRGPFALILCGDLIRAVRRESGIAVAHWWGVSPATVSGWRRALDVEPSNAGTQRLRRDWVPEKITPEVFARCQRLAHTPEANAKKGAGRRGKPMHPNARASIDAHRVRKHPPLSRKKMSAAQRRRRAWPPSAGRPWTAQEDALLEKMSAEEVARRIGRTLTAVYLRRQDLGIRLPRSNAWTPEEDALLRTLSDEEVMGQTGRGRRAVEDRRRKLRILRKLGRKRKNQ